MRPPLLVLALLLVTGCASPTARPAIEARVAGLLPAEMILLGEQHDAPEHQRIHRDVIESLAARGALAAVALEMAPRGGSTGGLPRDATEAAVKSALRWDEAAWPWTVYAPAVMAAVRAGVTVQGANLPRADMRAVMAQAQLDSLLNGPALKAQQESIRNGHCGLLPESQIAPMARIQIARDQAMAQTLAQLSSPGMTVVLLAGAAHVNRRLGVPLHLRPGVRVRAVALRAGPTETTANTDEFDATWTTPPVPPKDYCAELRRGARP